MGLGCILAATSGLMHRARLHTTDRPPVLCTTMPFSGQPCDLKSVQTGLHVSLCLCHICKVAQHARQSPTFGMYAYLPLLLLILCLLSVGGARLYMINMIACFRYLISQHPEVEERILQELAQHDLMPGPHGAGRALRLEDLSRLTYLNCVIKVNLYEDLQFWAC